MRYRFEDYLSLKTVQEELIEITSFQSGNSQERSQGNDYVHELNESELEIEFSDFSQEDQEENSMNQDRMAGSPIALRYKNNVEKNIKYLIARENYDTNESSDMTSSMSDDDLVNNINRNVNDKNSIISLKV